MIGNIVAKKLNSFNHVCKRSVYAVKVSKPFPKARPKKDLPREQTPEEIQKATEEKAYRMSEKSDHEYGVLSAARHSIYESPPFRLVFNYTFAQFSAAVRSLNFKDALRVLYNSYYDEALERSQLYSPEREAVMGSDLAAAHFLLRLGCHVRFVGHKEYYTDVSLYKNALPEEYDSQYKLEAIKLNSVELTDNGFRSLKNLSFVKHFDASRNPYYGDAQIDRTFTQFGTTLESINISECHNVTSNGLTALARFRKLKVLEARNLEYIQHLELVCLLLQESIPDLAVEGVTYKALEDFEDNADSRIEQNSSSHKDQLSS